MSRIPQSLMRTARIGNHYRYPRSIRKNVRVICSGNGNGIVHYRLGGGKGWRQNCYVAAMDFSTKTEIYGKIDEHSELINNDDHVEDKNAVKLKDNSLILNFKTISELSKLRLSALVVATSSAGFLAAGGPVSWSTLTACSLGTALCASSAATFNQVFEVERDGNMKRTRNRPLPSKIVTKQTACTLGLATGATGTAALAIGTDPITASLGLGNIVLYAGLYTYMKPRSELNTWVGAIVGAIPPVMGWTAAGGSIMDPEAILLGGTLFLWQFPHFFALSWMHRVDYARGGFEMVPCNDPTGDRTANLIKRYTMYMSTIPIVSTCFGITNSMFAVEGIAINAYALYVARNFDKERTNGNARKVFLTSLWYLPCLMTLFILHSKSWRSEEDKDKDWLQTYIHNTINRIRSKGKDLCIHETEVVKGSKEVEICPVTLTRKTSALSIRQSVSKGTTNDKV